MLRKNGGQSSGKIGIREQRKPFFYPLPIKSDPVKGVAWGTRVVHGPASKLGKVRQALRLRSRQDGAEPGQTVEQMAEQHLNRPGASDRRRPVGLVRWQESDEVNGPLNLFLNLFQKRGTQDRFLWTRLRIGGHA